MDVPDFDRSFEFENGFYLTASTARISKFVTHLDLFRRVTGLPGEIIECGVFKGFSFARWVKFRDLLENASSRRIIGFDIFGDFPEGAYEPDRKLRDKFITSAGSRGISSDALMSALGHHGLDRNVELIAGDVCETVPRYAEDHPELRIALLHVDVDLYEPTKATLDHFFPKVVSGGVVVLDDYGAFPGANRAVAEVIESQGIQVQKLPFSNNVCYVVKP